MAYFEQNSAVKNYDQELVNDLTAMLPATLKIALLRFLNKESIQNVKFLQNRSDTFYLNYLEKFKPMHFDKEEILYEKGHKAREVFISTSGEMLIEQSNRILKYGSMIGQDEILYKQNRQYTVIAHTELQVLRLEKDDFMKMMKEFPEIMAAITEQANLRKLYTQRQMETR